MELNINRMLVLDLRGAMAHFRTFYTNSSSLTYSFPPRTVITGILAGITGRLRDSYYREFSREMCRIALSVRTPFRKIMNTLNYSWMKSSSDFVVNPGQHLQVQFETIVPDQYGMDWGELVYRIYFWHSQDELMDEIKRRTQDRRYVYPPYMGISEFTAELVFVGEFSEDDIQIVQPHGYDDFSTVLNAELLAENGLEFQNGDMPLQYIKEVMPVEFRQDRSNRTTGSFVFEKNLHHVRAKLNAPYIRARSEDLVFMESDYA